MFIVCDALSFLLSILLSFVFILSLSLSVYFLFFFFSSFEKMLWLCDHYYATAIMNCTLDAQIISIVIDEQHKLLLLLVFFLVVKKPNWKTIGSIIHLSGKSNDFQHVINAISVIGEFRWYIQTHKNSFQKNKWMVEETVRLVCYIIPVNNPFFSLSFSN